MGRFRDRFMTGGKGMEAGGGKGTIGGLDLPKTANRTSWRGCPEESGVGGMKKLYNMGWEDGIREKRSWRSGKGRRQGDILEEDNR